MKKTRQLMAVGVALLCGASAQALSLNIDVVLADVAGQTASADISFVDNTHIQIIFRNTTGAGGPAGANGLLTGIAFNLPSGNNITAGNVKVNTGSTIRGGSLNGSGAGTSLQGEWGYSNAKSGHFNGLSVDTQVSAMEADTTTAFGASIDNPAVLDGPEYGLMRTGGDRGGLTAIENSVVITLTLANSVGGGAQAAYLASIDAGTVAVTFGSPSGGTTTVPDGGATVMLLGAAFAAVGFGRRLIK